MSVAEPVPKCAPPGTSTGGNAVDGSSPDRTSASARPRSSAVWYRSPGPFASARASTASTASGSPSTIVLAGFGTSITCFMMRTCELVATNGGRPATIS